MEASEDHVCLLIEILSGSNLLIRDKRAKSSDPYVKVKLNGKDIHQTKVVSKTLNPTFGDAQNNSFLLDCSAKDLFDSQGLLFKVKDHNRLSSDEDMGSIHVPAINIYKATGEPMVFNLVPPSDKKGETVGSITIRCWPATEAHLKKFGKEKKGLRGFVSGIQSNVKELQHDAKERMTNLKEDISTKLHVKDNKKDDEGSVEPAKERKIETLSEVEDEPDIVVEEAITRDPHIMEKVNLVVEVVAGKDLLAGDHATSDPYVKVMLGDQEVHKTKHLVKTLNPVFTPELDSTFILECTDATLSDKKGLSFVVKDWDMFGSNEELGKVQIAYTTLTTKGNGDAMEFMVEPPKNVSKEAGYLLIRWRKATSDDFAAMKDKKNKNNLFGPTTLQAASAAWALVDKKEPEPEAKAGSPQKAAEELVGQTAEGRVDLKPHDGEKLHIRVEIVSCRGLISADKGGASDPYVKIIMAGKDLHKTKHVLKTLNPIFADMDNVYTMHCSANELFEAGGISLKVKDWDRIGKNDDLGIAEVPAAKIYTNLDGKDMEFKIAPPKGKEQDDAGYVTIRFSSTSEDDHTGEKKKFLGMTAPEIKVPVPHLNMPKIIKPVGDIFGGKKDRGLEIDEEEEPLFIQMVSCRDLLAADKTGLSDPYVKVKLGKKDLFETKHVLQTLNPVFESKHNAYFVMEAKPSEVRAAGGLTFKVKDWDRVGANDDLGQVTVDPDTLYKCEGANMELKLSPPKGVGEAAGFVTVRIRPATESDRLAKKSGFFGAKNLSLTDYGAVDLHLLVEIVSGWNLPIADLTSSDPYVKVKIGPRNIHQTKPISNTRAPIYTIKHDSVFIMDIATKEIKENGGVLFKVKDYDMIGSNDDLCEATVSAEKILEASGERMEVQMKSNGRDAGFIAIRIRPATNYDRDFLKNLKTKDSNRDFMGLKRSYEKTMQPKGGSGNRLKAILKTMVKEENGVKKFRVRPYPDPERETETQFMSEDDINMEAFKPSRRWLDVGSGDLGKVYVEILGADGLPNKDQDFGGGNKTDPFVSIVYEDCVAKTDIIDDCLSPRWLPWMQRAFVFRMLHTSSNMHIAVFDYDPGFSGDHDICGRVSIDLANLQSGVEYLLRYKIYENSVFENREPKGILMVRLRMELKPEKDRILSNLKMPPEFYVNVKNSKDFGLVRQTVGGRQDLQKYSKDTLQLYVDELMGYRALQYYIYDSLIAVLFWRGQARVFGVWLPLTSLALFFAAITLAERPSLYPSYFFFGVAWSLLSVQTWRNTSSNPWRKTKTFVGLTQELIFGASLDGPPKTIAAHQNEKEAQAEEKMRKDRIEKARKQAEEYAKAHMKFLEEHQSTMNQVGDQTAETDISTQSGSGMSIDPLKFILYPIQQYLGMACNGLRIVRNFLIWDEPYLAYILTLACFAIGLVCLILPWAFIIRWTSRILAWGLLGPHMKLVDIYYFSKLEELSEEDRDEQIRQQLVAQLETARTYAKQARIQRERAVKLKDIKQALYGNFITKVPVIRSERFPDIPLHSSTAQPYKAPENQTRAIADRVPGQHLVGDMIPRIMDDDGVQDEEKVNAEAKKND